MGFFKKEVFTKEELKIKEVVERMLQSEDTLIELDPTEVGLDYILSNGVTQFDVVIDTVGIQISNHEFARDIHLSSAKIDFLKKLCKTETHRRRTIRKEKIFHNKMTLLDKIIATLDKSI